jgi:hypothetical protein
MVVIGRGFVCEAFVCEARCCRMFLVRLFYQLFGPADSSDVGVIDGCLGSSTRCNRCVVRDIKGSTGNVSTCPTGEDL